MSRTYLKHDTRGIVTEIDGDRATFKPYPHSSEITLFPTYEAAARARGRLATYLQPMIRIVATPPDE